MSAFVQTIINRYSLFCPICGTDVLAHYLRDEDPCIHVLYIYFDEIQSFVYISDLYIGVFDERGAYIRSVTTINRFNTIQQNLPQSVLHLMLDTESHTIGALTGVMRIGFDFNQFGTLPLQK